MREHHLKMICNDHGDTRREWTLTPDAVFVIKEGFEVHSALYGDGKSRYEDVTKVVQGWAANAQWPDNWREVLYATRKSRMVGVGGSADSDRGISDLRSRDVGSGSVRGMAESLHSVSLKVHAAYYGISDRDGDFIEVSERLQSLVKDGSLDIIVNNSTLTPGQNPFRGKKKRLHVVYSIDGAEYSDRVERLVEEKDWLIIGQGIKAEAERFIAALDDKTMPKLMDDNFLKVGSEETARLLSKRDDREGPALSVFESQSGVRKITQLAPNALPMTAAALNDYLVRRFQISPQRLRGPMPIELRNFHRNDLAQLFAELGFKRGAEIGVAEGNYSEVLLKANPECELLLVDPWHMYSENPQSKSNEKHQFALRETERKVGKYKNVEMMAKTSMDAVRYVDNESLNFCYIDGNHLFDYVMQDLIEWSKRVRSGGIVSGDDYYALDQKRWVGGGVVEAVQAYTNAHRISIWYLFEGHKSVDFMWVKP